MKKGFVTAGTVAIVALVLVIVGVSANQVINKSEKNEPLACTQEAKMCPDGSYVGRVGPNCEFAECPVLDNEDQTEPEIVIDEKKKPETVACTQEAKMCPDGSYVGRVGPNCEFAECPPIQKNNNDPELPPNLGDCNGPDEDCTCSEGYTKTQQAGLFPEPYYYCKINMDWEDFKSCSKVSDCNQENGFYCISKDIDFTQTGGVGKDYRCVPSESYRMSCLCELGKGCMCS